MPYKDYQEFERLVISKNPCYENHVAVGSDFDKVKEVLKMKMNQSTDLFEGYNGIRACKKDGNRFLLKCGNGIACTWEPESNRFDCLVDMNLPDEDWSKEE